MFTESPLDFGAGDIYSADFPHSEDRAGAFCLVMALARDGSGLNVVNKIFVILPPLEATNITADSITSSIVKAAEAHFGRELSEDEHTAINTHVEIVRSSDLTVLSALKALESVGKNQAAILLRSSAYRSGATPEGHALPLIARFAEDQWTHHLVALAEGMIEYAKRSECYILIDTGAPAPHRKENQDALKSVKGCGLFSVVSSNDVNEVMALNVNSWVEQAQNGHLGAAFRAIDELPEWMDDHKSFLKLQILDRVAPGNETLKMLRAEVAGRDYLDPTARVKLAQIARRADDSDFALQIVAPGIAELTGQEDLELALEIASSDDDLCEQIEERLGSLFPASSRLFERKVTRLFDERRYADAVELLDETHPAIDHGLERFYRVIAQGLKGRAVPDYAGVVKRVFDLDPVRENWARSLCAREALARQDFLQSMEVCVPGDERPMSSGTARMLIRAMQQVLLQRDGAGLVITGDNLALYVCTVLDYLAANPTDAHTRVRLVDLLSVETAGTLGEAVAVSIVLNRAGATALASSEKRHPEHEKPASNIDLNGFLKKAFEWMDAEAPILLHLSAIPASLLPASPDLVFEDLRQFVHHDQDLRDETAAHLFERVVFLAAFVARLTSTPNEDLDILRYAAARFIAAHKPQKARDLAEQALALAENTLPRKRLAWLAFADIYHRSHNSMESLIALACVFTVEVEITVEDMWGEAFLLFRVLRDLKIFFAAEAILDRLRETLPLTAIPARYEQRLITMELGLAVASYSFQDQPSATSLAELSRRVKNHYLALETTDEDLSPALSLLIHTEYLAKLYGFPANAEIKEIIRVGLPKAPTELADVLEAVSSPTPDGHGLIALTKSLEEARFYQDIAFDLTHIATASRRFLDTSLSQENAQTVVLAIEVLSDLAIRATSTVGSHSTFSLSESSLERAVLVSRSGYQVVFMGLSEAGRLVRVDVVEGAPTQVFVEEESVFSRDRFRIWAETFPYGYANSQDPNVFWTSTESLGCTLASLKPTLLIMDTTLQQLPPNLLRVGGDFIGRTIPIGSAPSMSWLANVRSNEPTTSKRPSRAWIPTDAGKDIALDWLAERLSEPLRAHDISLRSDVEVPEDLMDSELVIVGAHGGLLPGEHYFHRVSDNVNLAIYPETLASAVKGSGVVVLFICSGGRIDSHPLAETTVGLIKQLFNQGCSTIVASPWPLNVKVPPVWLPVFLDRWSKGDSVAHATFAANDEVMKVLGGNPVDYLAMNVFGDPLRTKKFGLDYGLQ